MINKQKLYTNQTSSRWKKVKNKKDILLSQLISMLYRTNLAG